MKKAGMLILSFFLTLVTFAQDESYQSIVHKGETKISGFGGPMMNFTQIGPDFAHMMGGGGGVIINNFFFGGYGMGKTNELAYKNDITGTQIMGFGHGGFWLGYTMFYNKAIHPAFHTQIGWGGISKRQKNWDYVDTEPEEDRVFVLSPTAELEMNFSRFFKLGAGITYTFVYNTDGPYTYDDFKKPGFFVSFKFGWF